MIGRIEFEGGVVGTVDEITLGRGALLLTITVDAPHPSFDGSHWRLYDPDGTLVAITREDRVTQVIDALGGVGETTITLPLGFTLGGVGDPVDFVGRL